MVTWLYPGLYCTFVQLFIVFVEANRCDKCRAWAVHERLFSQVVEHAEHHIWRRRKVWHDRWPHTGRLKSFTETRSCGPRIWNSYKCYFVANNVADARKQCAFLLSCCGAFAYSLIWSLAASNKLTDIAYKNLLEKVMATLPPDTPGFLKIQV